MKLKLSEDQEKAVEYLIKFVNTPAKEQEDNFATLSGYAGTGKTTIMKYVIIETSRKRKICVSAPTHKAKEVIGNAVNLKAETIQSLLGLRPNIELTDFNPNKPVFEIKAEERIQYYDIIIIDEASMINKDAFDLIVEKANKYNVKVIFMGDKYQLPPVGEVISKVFNLKNVVSLEKIHRQEGSNPNTKLIELARNDVANGTDTVLSYLKQIPADLNNNDGFETVDKVTYYEKVLERFYDSEYQQNPDLVKVLCWQNKIVGETNRYIRYNLIKSDELVAVGDILMGYKTITKEVNYPPFYINLVRNSADYIVTKVDIVENRIYGVTLKGYHVVCKDCELPMFILHRDSYEDFAEELAERLEKAKNFKQWKSYYDFKEQVICLEDIRDQFGSLVCGKDIDYGYAITVHKSQGSTYTNVGVTLKDLLNNRTPQERRKLIYVALSRASKLNLIYA